jgi:hypothetical protein
MHDLVAHVGRLTNAHRYKNQKDISGWLTTLCTIIH